MIGTAVTAVVAQQNREHRSWQPAGGRRGDRTWGQGRGRMKLLVVVVVVHEYDGPRVCWLRSGCNVDVDGDVEGGRKLGEAGNQSARADTWLWDDRSNPSD